MDQSRGCFILDVRRKELLQTQYDLRINHCRHVDRIAFGRSKFLERLIRREHPKVLKERQGKYSRIIHTERVHETLDGRDKMTMMSLATESAMVPMEGP